MRNTHTIERLVLSIVFLACVLAAAPRIATAQLPVKQPDKKSDKQPVKPTEAPAKANILFLHHSTGGCIWGGGVEAWFADYNAKHKTRYAIREQNFPKDDPYGWNNYPYDYWNIWVRHAGDKPYMTEPTLEMLAPKHDVIIFKHCFPVSSIEPDTGKADVASNEKRIENYKLQYDALKKKLRQFSKTKFIVWTGAALVKAETDEAAARRAKAFAAWVRDTWDEPGDNIFVWDFYTLETDGGLYLKDSYAQGDSHPNEEFSRQAAPPFCRRIVDVIRGAGDNGTVTDGRAMRRREEPKPTPQAEPKLEPKSEAKPGAERTDRETPETATPKDAPSKKPPKVEAVMPDAADRLIFDDAEDAKRGKLLWGAAAKYDRDGKDNVIRIRFADGKEEDWGEYGRQRIVSTLPPEKNLDIAAYHYVALRIKVQRPMEVVVTLITRPDGLPRNDDSHFGFTAYLHPEPGDWRWIALDLTMLELGTEGDKAYAAAGKPTRPRELTSIRLVTNEKNKDAAVAIDDIAFYQELPQALQSKLQAP